MSAALWVEVQGIQPAVPWSCPAPIAPHAGIRRMRLEREASPLIPQRTA